MPDSKEKVSKSVWMGIGAGVGAALGVVAAPAVCSGLLFGVAYGAASGLLAAVNQDSINKGDHKPLDPSPYMPTS